MHTQFLSFTVKIVLLDNQAADNLASYADPLPVCLLSLDLWIRRRYPPPSRSGMIGIHEVILLRY
jgi:hypothetical protein